MSSFGAYAADPDETGIPCSAFREPTVFDALEDGADEYAARLEELYQLDRRAHDYARDYDPETP